MWKYVPFTFRSSLRNKRRTLLTVASIGISLFLLGMLIAVYHAFYYRTGPPEEALRLVSRNRVSLTFSLPEYYGERIKQVAGVREVVPSYWFGGIYIDNRPEHLFPRFATDPEKTVSRHQRVSNATGLEVDDDIGDVAEKLAVGVVRAIAAKTLHSKQRGIAQFWPDVGHPQRRPPAGRTH